MKYYRVTNIADQKITLMIRTQDGRLIEDSMERNEVCYGINEHAAAMLRFYEWMGVIKIEQADQFAADKVNWLAEGF